MRCFGKNNRALSMRSAHPKRQLASQVLRLSLTACAAVLLLAYGTANRLAVESFIGIVLALYTGYGVWLAIFGLRHVQYELRINKPSHAPFHKELSSNQLLSSPVRLPRLFVRVTTCWERIESDDPLYEQVCVLLPRGHAIRSWKAVIADLPAGTYRHRETRVSTGDLWGWFVRERVYDSVGIELTVVPQAAYWSEDVSMELPRSMNTIGAYRYEQPRDEGELTAELRAYRAGDGSRSVHWRQYMKSRQLAVRVRQPEANDVITVAIDDTWMGLDSLSAEAMPVTATVTQGEALLTAAGEWLWLSWLQGCNIQVLWLQDGAVMTDKQQIAAELVRRCYLVNAYEEQVDRAQVNGSWSSSQSVVTRIAALPSMERVTIRETVLISATRHDQALEKLQRIVRSCHVHTWVIAKAEV